MKNLHAEISHSETKMTIQHAAYKCARPGPATVVDLMLATTQRRAMHEQIVERFKAFALALGSGPCESELRTFAHLAIAEQRLARALGRPVDDAASCAQLCTREISE